MKRCRDASTTDPKAKHYIDILLSSVEYDTFVKLMRLMRPVAQQHLGDSDSKNSFGDNSKKERSSPAKAAKDESYAADSKTSTGDETANEKFEKASAK